MFRIEKKKGSKKNLYTYRIYFNGKLLSDNVSIHDGIFYYDEDGEPDISKYLNVKISNLPEALEIRTFGHGFHREFELSTFRRKGDEMVFRVCAFPDFFEGALWNYLLFCKILLNTAKKKFHCETRIYGGDDGAIISFVVPCRQDEKIKDAYMRAKKMFVQVYDITTKKLQQKAYQL